MNQSEFLAQWNTDKTMFRAWGTEVVDTVRTALRSEHPEISLDVFLRIDPKPRIKEDGSLITKAFYRNKQYSDPYHDIEDKVGVRFVVLLRKDIEVIRSIVATESRWQASEDRNFLEEQAKDPYSFSYSAFHYVVRSSFTHAYNLDGNDVNIIVGTPCEIQIKTLLQHAYSELTHDTIYKPKIQASPDIRRSSAKSMALLEAADDYFSIVQHGIDSEVQKERDVLSTLQSLYSSIIGREGTTNDSDVQIVSAYLHHLPDQWQENLGLLIKDDESIISVIQNVGETYPLVNHPSILLVIYLAKRRRDTAKNYWPFTPTLLEDAIHPFGISV